MKKQAAPPKRKFPVPWGLFVALAVYALAVWGYVWKTYWSSPEYLAAQHYAQALRILGVDDGRKCSEKELLRAFEHVLEAARLMPRVKPLVEHAERLRWRFDERKLKLPEEYKRRVEAVSAVTRRIEQEQEPWLVVGVRDKGWAADQLLEGPEKVVWWSIPGGVVIILIWAYGRFSARAVRDREHEEDLKAKEREVEQLAEYRKGLKPAPSATQEDDDADTIAEPPKPRPPSQRRPAVKRRPQKP